MDNKTQKMAEKVRKILAKAGNNPSQEEAHTAMMMAQELMARYGLEMRDVEIQEKKEARIEYGGNYGRKLWWKISLHRVIAENFRCASVIFDFGGSNKQMMGFVGTGEDAEIAKQVYEFALQAIKVGGMRCCREFRKKGMDTTGKRDSYRDGFLKGLEKRFKDQREAHQEWGLVLVRPKEVNEYIGNHCNKLSPEQLADLLSQQRSKDLLYDRLAGNMGFQDGYEFGESSSPSRKRYNQYDEIEG
ncbi:MAG: DUF2786 domain-containing protein [Bacilli bacterium]